MVSAGWTELISAFSGSEAAKAGVLEPARQIIASTPAAVSANACGRLISASVSSIPLAAADSSNLGPIERLRTWTEWPLPARVSAVSVPISPPTISILFPLEAIAAEAS